MRKNGNLVIGICLLAVATALFIISLSATIEFPPAEPQDYVVPAFAIFGIYSGVNSGKGLAYHLHDKDCLLRVSKGNGPVSTAVGSIIRWPLIVSTIIFVLWSLSLLILGFTWSAVSDKILLGHVRWALIISMGLLIAGSFILFRSTSAGKEGMLTRRGRLLMSPYRPTMGGAAELADLGGDIIKSTVKEGPGIVEYRNYFVEEPLHPE